MNTKLTQPTKLLKGFYFVIILTIVKIYEYFIAPLYATDKFPMNQLWLAMLIVFLIIISTMILEIIEVSIFVNTCFDADHFYELIVPLIITLTSIYVSNLLPLNEIVSIYTIAIHIKTACYSLALIGKTLHLILKCFEKK